MQYKSNKPSYRKQRERARSLGVAQVSTCHMSEMAVSWPVRRCQPESDRTRQFLSE